MRYIDREPYFGSWMDEGLTKWEMLEELIDDDIQKLSSAAEGCWKKGLFIFAQDSYMQIWGVKRVQHLMSRITSNSGGEMK